MTALALRRETRDRDGAFEGLYRAYVQDVYRYALMVMRTEADAEDITQTTFLKAYRAFQRGERPQKPQHWLIRIAHNTCRTRFRDASRRPQEVAFEEGRVAAVGRSADDGDAPTVDEIRRALAQLSLNQRAAIVMREVEGRSYSEIGDVLGLSMSAVETLLFRARRALREQLEGALTCGDAGLALSKDLDGRLSHEEKGQLRAHLRSCKECSTWARRQRAQRAALRGIGPTSLPPSLASFFGGGGAAATGAAAKLAAVLAAGVVTVGVGYERSDAVAAQASPESVQRAAVVVDAPVAASPVAAAVARIARSAPAPAGPAARRPAVTPTVAPHGGRRAEPDAAAAPEASARARVRPAPVTAPATRRATATGPAAPTRSEATPALEPARPQVVVPAVAVRVPAPPRVTLPAATVPAVTVPSASTPAVTTPIATVPAVTTPSVTTPAVSTPAVETPAVSVPTVNTPAISLPAPAVPSLP